jgi:(2Fe-2S) ferredoxin
MIGYRQSLKNVVWEVLNEIVDSHLIVQIRVERNLIFQTSLEVGQLNAPEISEFLWVVEG